MAESVVSFVMERLSSLLVEEVQLLSGVRYQVEEIQGELERMRCFLKDADARQNENVMIRNWIAEIRELAHDIEDVLEMYAFKIPFRPDATFLGKFISIFKDGVSLHQVGSEIQRIRTRISGIITSMKDYGIKQISERESPRYRRPRRAYHHNVDQDFVGLDNEVDMLVTRLMNQEDRVVSICGMGGVGKSTIARKIYHHDGVKNHFKAFAWLSISQNWNLRDVLEGLLTKLSKEKKREEIANLKDDELMEEVCTLQIMKKCLVVLDDIWSLDFWEQMQPSFPTGNSDHDSGSKIIITTRKREVAMSIDSCFPYEPRLLYPEESWELLKKKAFPKQYSPDPTLAETTERIGREMSAQCGGLPLAIIVLGGILTNKSRLSDWEEVKQNLNRNLRKGRGDEEYGVVYEVLTLSYYDLPYHLKHCFLQMGIFPEDYRIPARKLIQLWAAEGFISLGSHHPGEGEETMTDVGERYLGELAKRYMVHVQVDDSTGRFKSCRLHDLMRDVCLSKGKEENFLKILPHKGEHEPRILLPSTSRNSLGAGAVVRRLSVTVSKDLERYFPPNEETTQRIRTAVFFCTLSRGNNLQSTLFLMCSKFQLLRILDLENSELGKKIPKVIGNLLGLRFMSFRNCEFGKLSSSVGNLKYLQTLDLRVKFFCNLTMPNVLWKLQHLRHLYLPPSHGNINILWLGSLRKLETLKNFDTRCYDFTELMKLPNLRKLSATFVLQVRDLEEVTHYMNGESNRLRDVALRVKYNFQTERDLTLLSQLMGCRHLRKLDLIESINELPHFRHFSSSLTSLTLRKSSLVEDPMATLEKLPTLSTLALRANAFAGKKMRCSAHGFSQLKTLDLQGLHKLKKWKIEEGAMPSLTHLEIDGCQKLVMVPDGLRYVTSMKELVIANMPGTFSRRLKVVNEKQGADIDKVQHIPSITFRETSKDVKKILAWQKTGEVLSALMQNFSPSTVPKSWQTL